MSHCCLCCDNGKCVHCLCVQAGRTCFNCLPSRGGHCSNLISDERACTSAYRNHDSTQSDGDGNVHSNQRTLGESAVSLYVYISRMVLEYSCFILKVDPMIIPGVNCGYVLYHLRTVIMTCLVVL